MADLGGYQANPAELEEDFGIVPEGTYIAVIEGSDYKPASTGQGMLLKFTYSIVEGQFKGRKVFENLNLKHSNAQTQAIAEKALNSICVACGILKIQDSSQLHGIPMKLDISVQPAKGEYSAQNRIKKHISINATPATGATQGVAVENAVNPDINPATGKPYQPWEKKP